jgi:hypothetical protein
MRISEEAMTIAQRAQIRRREPQRRESDRAGGDSPDDFDERVTRIR